MLVRAVIAISVFIFIVPHFGWILFALGILSIVFYMFLLFLMYQLVEIVPVLLSKPVTELETILADYGDPQEEQRQTTIDIEPMD